MKLFLTSIYLIFTSDFTSEYEELQLTPASEPSEPLLYQSLDDKEDNNERWYSQSVKEESTQEPNIYAAPRHKSVGSKSSIKLSRMLLLTLKINADTKHSACTDFGRGWYILAPDPLPFIHANVRIISTKYQLTPLIGYKVTGYFLDTTSINAGNVEACSLSYSVKSWV